MGFVGGHWVYLVILFVIVLIIWGPGKMPDVGAGLGRAIREFRKASAETQDAFTHATTTPVQPTPQATTTQAPVQPTAAPEAASVQPEPAPVQPAGPQPAQPQSSESSPQRPVAH